MKTLFVVPMVLIASLTGSHKVDSAQPVGAEKMVAEDKKYRSPHLPGGASGVQDLISKRCQAW